MTSTDKPSGNALNVVYDHLRTLTVPQIKTLYDEAYVRWLKGGSATYDLFMHQCCETIRRYRDPDSDWTEPVQNDDTPSETDGG